MHIIHLKTLIFSVLRAGRTPPNKFSNLYNDYLLGISLTNKGIKA